MGISILTITSTYRYRSRRLFLRFFFKMVWCSAEREPNSAIITAIAFIITNIVLTGRKYSNFKILNLREVPEVLEVRVVPEKKWLIVINNAWERVRVLGNNDRQKFISENYKDPLKNKSIENFD